MAGLTSGRASPRCSRAWPAAIFPPCRRWLPEVQAWRGSGGSVRLLRSRGQGAFLVCAAQTTREANPAQSRRTMAATSAMSFPEPPSGGTVSCAICRGGSVCAGLGSGGWRGGFFGGRHRYGVRIGVGTGCRRFRRAVSGPCPGSTDIGVHDLARAHGAGPVAGQGDAVGVQTVQFIHDFRAHIKTKAAIGGAPVTRGDSAFLSCQPRTKAFFPSEARCSTNTGEDTSPVPSNSIMP